MTYLALYTVLNNMTRVVQTVTVSSEGPAAEMYPDSMGQYNILREVYRYDRAVADGSDTDVSYISRIVLCPQQHDQSSPDSDC